MEVVYHLFSIMSTLFTSFALSLRLLFRTIFSRLFSSHSTVNAAGDTVITYEGVVWHERRHPVRHSFRYSVRYALFDIECSPHQPPDHLSADQARRVAETTGPVHMLSLMAILLQVTNSPWGERVTFVFNSNSDLVAKPLHVSPFMDMQGNCSIRANAPGDSLSVVVSVQHPEHGDYFVATLKAKRITSLECDHNLFFWLMPQKVAFWIYWHALKLYWKKVQFIQHPRYSKPEYREEALLRDQKLECCWEPGRDKDEHLQDERFNGRNYIQRQFKWRDAKWPWC